MKILEEKKFVKRVNIAFASFAFLFCFPVHLYAQNDLSMFVVWQKKLPLPSGKLIFENLSLKDSLMGITVRQKDKTLLLETNLNFDTLIATEAKEKRLENEIWSGMVDQTFVQVLHRNSFGNTDKLLMRVSGRDSTYLLAEFNSDPANPAHFFVKSLKGELFIALQPTARHFRDSARIHFWFVLFPDLPANGHNDNWVSIKKSTFSLGYEERLTEAIDIFFVHNQIKMLHKVYHINALETRHFQPNYEFHLSTLDRNANLISTQKLPFRPETYYLRVRCFTKEKIVVATYGNSSKNAALGYYLFNYGQSEMFNWDTVHLPFGSNIIRESQLNYFEKPKAVVAIHPDLLWKDDSGNIYIVGEQYFNKRVGSSGRETLYSFHYGAVVYSKISPDFKPLEEKLIRKKQRSYNDRGQQLSYNVIFRNGEPIILFNHHKKYLQNKNIKFNNGRRPAIYCSVQGQDGIWYQRQISQSGAVDLALLPHLITRISDDQYLVIAGKKRNLYVGYLYLREQP